MNLITYIVYLGSPPSSKRGVLQSRNHAQSSLRLQCPAQTDEWMSASEPEVSSPHTAVPILTGLSLTWNCWLGVAWTETTLHLDPLSLTALPLSFLLCILKTWLLTYMWAQGENARITQTWFSSHSDSFLWIICFLLSLPVKIGSHSILLWGPDVSFALFYLPANWSC